MKRSLCEPGQGQSFFKHQYIGDENDTNPDNRFIATAKDITEKKKLEMELSKNELW